ncbi:MAG: EFR1 family ferrodoxin [Lachnospiraceae bacterium]|nr:EFR1 family ferrodoxin [Lachnospiraceae bacterium]
MHISKVTAVFYSATGNTKKVITRLAESIAGHLELPMTQFDYTLPQSRETHLTCTEQELVIFGTPVYAGRIPNKLLPYVQSGFTGGNALAVPVVTFGNRSFDNGLTELRNELENHGFHTIAGAAIPTSHAFSDRIAPGRPDEKDWTVLEEFASAVAALIKKTEETGVLPEPIQVPGEDPPLTYYTPLGLDGRPTVFLKAKPQTHAELCDSCGVCAAACPMGSISKADPLQVPGVCIKCHACIRKCHAHAKYFADPAFLSHVAMLEENYTRRCEPALFL